MILRLAPLKPGCELFNDYNIKFKLMYQYFRDIHLFRTSAGTKEGRICRVAVLNAHHGRLCLN